MFVLVRHGHAVPRRSWHRRDSGRPLSERGRQQALGLVQTLSALDSPRLLSSPFERCRQTLLPLAEHHRGRVETLAELGPSARPGAVDALLFGPGLGAAAGTPAAVLCTHGEVLTRLLRSWRRRGTVRFADELSTDPLPAQGGRETEKGGAWIVTDTGDGPVAHYLRPLHVGPVLTPRVPGRR